MKFNIYKLFVTLAAAIFLAIPVIAQEKNNTLSDTLQLENRTLSSSPVDKKRPEFIRKLQGVWQQSNQVYETVLTGNSIKIENVAFYSRCRLVGTSGRVWNGSIIGDQIRGVYRKTIKGKTYERPFTGEIGANGKEIVIRYSELIYIDPVGDNPGQIIEFPGLDKLRKN